MSDGVTIRPAIAADAEAVRDLTRRAYAKWVPAIGREPLPMGFDQAAAIRDDRVEVMEIDGTIVGVAHLVVEDGRVLLENLAIDPDRAGRGLGRRMLARAEAVTRDLGRTRLALYTNARFGENLRFYAAAGYSVDREEAFRGGVVVHMSKVVVAG
ncbi:GNAT family N-acetyltransferase [Pinisolibacter sp.]|uniref:GNAT family N-acetyltransferase n=1 Tax=Pinisolibacter sp. TaxID=2172024 RepID=UPI002FDE678A